jgi:hypothetical protein
MMRKPYRRARTDYPAGVVAIYDNGGKTIDRYTVVYEPYPVAWAAEPTGQYIVFPYVGMSGSPFWPQGFCQHGETIMRRPYVDRNDRVIRFEDLPADCQKVVRRDLEPKEEGD